MPMSGAELCKAKKKRRKKLIWGIMLRVNIFYMLFEKLLYVTKELLLLDFIDFSPSHPAAVYNVDLSHATAKWGFLDFK